MTTTGIIVLHQQQTRLQVLAIYLLFSRCLNYIIHNHIVQVADVNLLFKTLTD